MNFCMVDKDRCAGDGLCVAACPMKLLRMEGKIPTGIEEANQMCVECGHCVASCPTGALSLKNIHPDDCTPLDAVPKLGAEEAALWMRARRSVRSYRKQPIEREKIERLIDIARYAPTGGNSQQVGWLVLSGREKIDRVVSETAAFLRHLAASDDATARRYNLGAIADAWDMGYDGIARGAPALLLAHAPRAYWLGSVDCTIAISHLELAAPAFGLGACWGGFIMMAAAHWPALKEMLAPPPERDILGALMIGYPAHRYFRIPPRKAADVKWL